MLKKYPIGEEVRMRRARCYLSQKALADLAGVDRRTIYNIEFSVHKPHRSTIAIVLAALSEREAEIERLRKEQGYDAV